MALNLLFSTLLKTDKDTKSSSSTSSSSGSGGYTPVPTTNIFLNPSAATTVSGPVSSVSTTSSKSTSTSTTSTTTTGSSATGGTSTSSSVAMSVLQTVATTPVTNIVSGSTTTTVPSSTTSGKSSSSSSKSSSKSSTNNTKSTTSSTVSGTTVPSVTQTTPSTTPSVPTPSVPVVEKSSVPEPVVETRPKESAPEAKPEPQKQTSTSDTLQPSSPLVTPITETTTKTTTQPPTTPILVEEKRNEELKYTVTIERTPEGKYITLIRGEGGEKVLSERYTLDDARADAERYISRPQSAFKDVNEYFDLLRRETFFVDEENIAKTFNIPRTQENLQIISDVQQQIQDIYASEDIKRRKLEEEEKLKAQILETKLKENIEDLALGKKTLDSFYNEVFAEYARTQAEKMQDIFIYSPEDVVAFKNTYGPQVDQILLDYKKSLETLEKNIFSTSFENKIDEDTFNVSKSKDNIYDLTNKAIADVLNLKVSPSAVSDTLFGTLKETEKVTLNDVEIKPIVQLGSNLFRVGPQISFLTQTTAIREDKHLFSESTSFTKSVEKPLGEFRRWNEKDLPTYEWQKLTWLVDTKLSPKLYENTDIFTGAIRTGFIRSFAAVGDFLGQVSGIYGFVNLIENVKKDEKYREEFFRDIKNPLLMLPPASTYFALKYLWTDTTPDDKYYKPITHQMIYNPIETAISVFASPVFYVSSVYKSLSEGDTIEKGETLGSIMGNVLASYLVAKGAQEIQKFGRNIKVSKEIPTKVDPTKIFDEDVLAGKKTFPTAKSPQEAYSEFLKTRTKEGKIMGVHATAQELPSQFVVRPGPAAARNLEDAGLYTAPYGRGSAYFLKIDEQISYSLNPLDIINLFRKKEPTAIVIKADDIRKPPSIYLKTPGFKDLNVWYQKVNQPGPDDLYTKFVLNILDDRPSPASLYLTKRSIKGYTSEIEAISPAGTLLIEDPSKRVRVNIKGWEVPVKTYTPVPYTLISEPPKSIINTIFESVKKATSTTTTYSPSSSTLYIEYKIPIIPFNFILGSMSNIETQQKNTVSYSNIDKLYKIGDTSLKTMDAKKGTSQMLSENYLDPYKTNYLQSITITPSSVVDSIKPSYITTISLSTNSNKKEISDGSQRSKTSKPTIPNREREVSPSPRDLIRPPQYYPTPPIEYVPPKDSSRNIPQERDSTPRDNYPTSFNYLPQRTTYSKTYERIKNLMIKLPQKTKSSEKPKMDIKLAEKAKLILRPKAELFLLQKEDIAGGLTMSKIGQHPLPSQKTSWIKYFNKKFVGPTRQMLKKAKVRL